MRTAWGLFIGLFLVSQLAVAQSLGDLARQERERKAKQEKPSVQVETDALRKGKVELSPPLDPARKGDLDYLLQQLSHPRTSAELFTAFIPLKEQAIPRLVPMLMSTDPLKRVAPANVLTVLGRTEGIAAMAHMLDETIAAAQAATGDTTAEPAARAEAFQQRMEATREANHALDSARLGVWRFTEGSAMTPEQVVHRHKTPPPIEIVGGVDNGQRIFNRALRDKDPNLRMAAIALVRVATGGNDFGFKPDQSPEQNEAAIQEIVSFIATERTKVMAALATKAR
ncbi:MAG: hypothetical protein ACE145_06595 [Terriglobia bacterium]